MTNTNRIVGNLPADLFTLEDESNPASSRLNSLWPSTILDQVYDNLSPTNKTLRQIIEELKQDIITGGRGNIVFPVTSVNNRTGDIIIGKNEVGLGNVDNTADSDKPLSGPQREAISKILGDYDFKINLSDLYDHIMNVNNPHDVSIEQINKNDELSTFVQDLISRHNYSGDRTVHVDIRRSLATLWLLVDEHIKSTKERMEELMDTLYDHIEDKNAHEELFNKKENIENKVTTFDSTISNDHTHYPSTRATVEFIARKLDEFRGTLPDVKTWVQDIFVIDNRDQLPQATKDRLRTSYIIRNGLVSHDEIAICRTNDDETYYWDISQLGSYSKFDDKYFMDSPDGLTLKMDTIRDTIGSGSSSDDTDTDTDVKCECVNAFIDPDDFSILNLTNDIFDDKEHLYLDATNIVHNCDDDNYEVLAPNTIRDNVNKIFNGDRNLEIETIKYDTLPCLDECHCADMFDGVTTTELGKIVDSVFRDIIPEVSTFPIISFDRNKTVDSIHIVSGTMDGCIRFYVNEDLTTMSENIRIAGLKRLAFMEYVTESEIWDQAIQENHIRDRAIRTRHIHDMAVTPEKIFCTHGFIIGNTENVEPKANEISLIDLAEMLRPLLGGWPDPNTPGGNPYYEQFAVQIPHPHLWKPGEEYNLGDYSYGMRFKGKISCLPDMSVKIPLSTIINVKSGYRMTDSGGAWVYQSKPESWITLNGSNMNISSLSFDGGNFQPIETSEVQNIVDHANDDIPKIAKMSSSTPAVIANTTSGNSMITSMIFMDTTGLYFETRSKGDRMDAEYDVWIRYVKLYEMNKFEPEIDNGGYVVPKVDGDVETGVIGSIGSGTSCDCEPITVVDNSLIFTKGYVYNEPDINLN